MKHAAPAPRRSRSAVVAVLGVALLVGSLGLLALPSGSDVASADPVVGSPVTLSGTGPFADLKVTLAKTKNLTNEVVDLTWTGGAETKPGSGAFAINYLQVMQCWGEDPTGPDRTQCEYGAKYGVDQRGGTYGTSRQLRYPTTPDPLEASFPGSDPVLVPFASVTGETIEGANSNKFFDANTSNELGYVATNSDGSGADAIELLTNREAPGLGCGQVVENKGPRGCWLVVVPRNDLEVDGSKRDTSSIGQLVSSPLSLTNWSHRIVFPLAFAAVDQVCPIGSSERRLVGTESAVDAVSRWQPVLCADGGAVYGYSQVADGVARRQLSSTQPGMAVLTRPLSGNDVPSGERVVYSPLSVESLGLAFLVERVYDPQTATAAEIRLTGSGMTSMKLTPRLLAKLLTQSYLSGDQFAPYLKGNPTDLIKDPDFLALNPEYAHLQVRVGSVMTPLGLSDLNAEIWDYILADQDARDFLAGAPDEHGMRVNPFYQGLVQARDDFPKSSPFCSNPVRGIITPGPLCTLDAFPYVSDLHDGARLSNRGDSNAKVAYDPTAVAPIWKKGTPQPPGQRALLTVTDSVSAVRFGLTMVALRNAAGEFLTPTPATMAAGLTAMSVDAGSGVLHNVPEDAAPGAYPIMAVSYATTVPRLLGAQEAREYAALLRYAAVKGQTIGADPGQMPLGYLPLTPALRAQAVTAASLVEQRVAAPSPTPSPTAAPTGGSGSGSGGTSGGGTSGGSVASTGGSAPAAPTSSAAAAPSSPAPTVTDAVAAASLTPVTPVPASRYALALALLVGAAAAVAGCAGLLVSARSGP